MDTSFNNLGLSEPVMKAITTMGFEEATPIQSKTIPVILEGRDLIGQAQTGTGKTAAFGIPIVQRIEPGAYGVQALIVVPTRELAVQAADEITKLGQFKGLRVLPIYGGQSIERQIRALKQNPHIVCGTPGRLLDHLNRRTLRLDGVKVVVLDEADEMLDMGFLDDIEAILEKTPEERQTLLFSATMPREIRSLAERFQKNPEHISIDVTKLSAPSIDQIYYEVSEKQKVDVLTRLLDIENPELALVFVRTKRGVDELTDMLLKRGYQAEGLHGDMAQGQRDAAMRKFREGAVDLLIATDVAARGLDISGITHVYNFDIPQDPESYVHRIGRTGRAGRKGVASTLVTPRELRLLKIIQRLTNSRIRRKPIPTLAEAIEGQQRLVVNKLLKIVRDGGGFSGYQALAEELLDQYDSVTLVSAALKMVSKKTVEPLPEAEQAEQQPVGERTRNRWEKSRGGKPRSFLEKRTPRRVGAANAKSRYPR